MQLKIKYQLTAPLSHIGETASTGSYFQTILTKDGKLPVITANAIRGQIRNSGAEYLLEKSGEKVDKEVFHTLFSGGNLSGTMKNDIEKSRKAREAFPIISVLGAGLGDIILGGKAQFTFAYPICKESEDITGIESDISWHNLIEEIEFTRVDDSKNDYLAQHILEINTVNTAIASTQMRYSVQYMAAGSEFYQIISLNQNTNDLEIGSFLSAILKWFETPKLGGMSGKGFGFFDADINNGALTVVKGIININKEYSRYIDLYNLFLKNTDLRSQWNFLKGDKKRNGKISNCTIEDNGKTG